MTTLAELRVKVSRDLRDTANRTFLAAVVDDLINAGMEEVSRIYPREVIDEIALVASTYAYATECESAFRCEVFRSDVFHMLLPQHEGDESSQTGWELFAGQLRLPKGTVDYLSASTDEIHLWGYGLRAQLLTDGQVADADDTAEQAVRKYARSSAFQLMHNDRALFKQWQAASQNNDVSPNQLNQMVALYSSEWDRTRNYLRRLRRV